MQNRVPVAREGRVPLPDFAPVPRKFRHDGWTPERQKAFIEALADTGSVTRAAGMVNMAQTNCYTLRRAPGAEEFRRAWDAALDFGVQRLKDIAFERAISGEFVPVFIGGSLKGFRRKYNDTLLMFCLRHYGQDAGSKRTTINYFSTRAQAGAVAGGGGSGAEEGGAAGAVAAVAAAEISTTTVRTVITGDGGEGEDGGDGTGGKAVRDDGLAEQLIDFDGIELDAAARAEIDAALLACAQRRRAVDDNLSSDNATFAIEQGLVDPDARFVEAPDSDAVDPYRLFEQHAVDGLGEDGARGDEADASFVEGEAPWRDAGRELSEHEMAMLGFIESGGGQGAMKLMPVGEGKGAVTSDLVAPVKRPRPRNNWDKRPRGK